MEEAQEDKKENGTGDAPANGTEVCEVQGGGGFPSRPCLVRLLSQLMMQVSGDSQQARSLPCCCVCRLCSLFRFVNFHRCSAVRDGISVGCMPGLSEQYEVSVECYWWTSHNSCTC